MLYAFAAFWVVLILGREELGLKGIGITIGVGIGLLAGFLMSGLPSSFFVVALALVDVVLVLIVFGGDIKLR